MGPRAFDARQRGAVEPIVRAIIEVSSIRVLA